MVYDAVSVHRGRMLSMETFHKAIGQAQAETPAPEVNPFASFERLPSFRITSYNVCYTKLLRVCSRAVLISRRSVSRRVS